MTCEERKKYLHLCNWKFEFSLINFTLGNVKRRYFESSQWPFMSPTIFFVYRLIILVYHLVIIVLTGANPHTEWLKENTNKYR